MSELNVCFQMRANFLGLKGYCFCQGKAQRGELLLFVMFVLYTAVVKSSWYLLWARGFHREQPAVAAPRCNRNVLVFFIGVHVKVLCPFPTAFALLLQQVTKLLSSHLPINFWGCVIAAVCYAAAFTWHHLFLAAGPQVTRWEAHMEVFCMCALLMSSC